LILIKTIEHQTSFQNTESVFYVAAMQSFTSLNFQILDYQATPTEDTQILSLLNSVFVGEGYTDEARAEKMFLLSKLQKR